MKYGNNLNSIFFFYNKEKIKKQSQHLLGAIVQHVTFNVRWAFFCLLFVLF